MKTLIYTLGLCGVVLIGLEAYTLSLLPHCLNGHATSTTIERFSPCETQEQGLHYLGSHDIGQLVFYLMLVLAIINTYLVVRHKKSLSSQSRTILIFALCAALFHLVAYGYRNYKLETGPVRIETCGTVNGVSRPCI